MFHNYKLSVMFLLAVILLPTFSIAHPSDGYQAKSLPDKYGTLDFKTVYVDRIGDLTFTCPYPDPDSLTEAEKYMVAGTEDGPGGYPLRPWIQFISMMISVYYEHESYIPGQFSEEMLLEVAGGRLPDQQWRIDEFKSPITNQFPRLDAWEFSSGDMYVHVLTDAEKLEYASQRPELYDLWFNRLLTDPNNESEMVEASPVPAIYIRVYGEYNVIWESVVIGASF